MIGIVKTTELISWNLFNSVTPILAKAATKQFVLYNQTSFLWCLAEGAPAPIIVWRKNGLVVQNSTSVRYSMGIVKRSNGNYSCEVNKNNEETIKEEIVLFIESEFSAHAWSILRVVYKKEPCTNFAKFCFSFSWNFANICRRNVGISNRMSVLSR